MNLKQNGRRRITTCFWSTSWRRNGRARRERTTGPNGIQSWRSAARSFRDVRTRLDGSDATYVRIYSRGNGRWYANGSKWRINGYGWRIILDASATGDGDGDAAVTRRHGPKHDALNGPKYARNDSRTNGLILNANATTTNDVVTDALIHWPINWTANRYQPNVSRAIASLSTTALWAATICKLF